MAQPRIARHARWAAIGLTVAALSGCGYNDIQRSDESTKSAWAEVTNQYQRRADLIPNLVNTVKGYAQQEKDVLTQVTEARSRVGQVQVNPGDEGSLKQFENAQANMSSALSRLLVVAENYPQLKSTRTSASCRPSWPAPRTASPSPASATSMPSTSTTCWCASSRST